MREICEVCLEEIICGYCGCSLRDDPHLAKRDSLATEQRTSRHKMPSDKSRQRHDITSRDRRQGARRRRRRRRR